MSTQEITIAYTKILSNRPNAMLFDCEGDAVWLPKSQIKINSKEQKITLPPKVIHQPGSSYSPARRCRFHQD